MEAERPERVQVVVVNSTPDDVVKASELAKGYAPKEPVRFTKTTTAIGAAP